MSAEQPLAFLIDHATLRICELMETRQQENAPLLRCQLFNLLHALPLCCATLISHARQNDAFEPVLFYERIRLRVASRQFFFDGVPRSVNLFSPFTHIHLPTANLQKLRLKDVMSDRIRFIDFAELAEVEGGAAESVADMSERIPTRVKSLVARCRAVCRGLQTVKPVSSFGSCQNCLCQRIFYRGDARESLGNADSRQLLVDSDSDDFESVSDSREYWERAACDRTVYEPSVRRFCSSVCSYQHGRCMRNMMPDAGVTLDTDDAASKTGRARVAEAFKLVLKRNEVASRALRTLRAQPLVALPVSRAEVEVQIERRVTALNIDLGVLYAATIIAESANLSRGKALPGGSLYWRDDAAIYSKALLEVTRIYQQSRRKEGIISSMLTAPKFMTAVAARAHKIIC